MLRVHMWLHVSHVELMAAVAIDIVWVKSVCVHPRRTCVYFLGFSVLLVCGHVIILTPYEAF